MKNKKRLANEGMTIITCDETARATTGAALGGGRPPDGPILDLPYAGACAMLKLSKLGSHRDINRLSTGKRGRSPCGLLQ